MKERIVDTLFEGTMDRVCKGRDKGIIDRVDDGYANMWVAPHDRQGLNERTVDGLDVRAFSELKRRSMELMMEPSITLS